MSDNRFRTDDPRQSIYFIRNKCTDKWYIGRSNDPERRFRDHMQYMPNDLFREDYCKYGRESFELYKSRFNDLTVEVAEMVEMFLILKCKTFLPEHGYNIRIGDRSPNALFYDIKKLQDEWVIS